MTGLKKLQIDEMSSDYLEFVSCFYALGLNDEGHFVFGVIASVCLYTTLRVSHNF